MPTYLSSIYLVDFLPLLKYLHLRQSVLFLGRSSYPKFFPITLRQKFSPYLQFTIDSNSVPWVNIEEAFFFHLHCMSKITVDGDCSQEVKIWLFLGRKTMANLDSILKSRDITLPTKVWIVKATVFPVVMYRSERVGS